jgi:hypothetical protein
MGQTEGFVLVGDVGPQESWMTVYVDDSVVLSPDKTYTLVVAEGSFSTEEGQLSEEITYEFLPSDFIYIPTMIEKVLTFLRMNFLTEIIFAPLIAIIEFFYFGRVMGGF